MDEASGVRDDPSSLYLDLMKNCVTRLAFPERYQELDASKRPKHLWAAIQTILKRSDLALVSRINVDRSTREAGKDWPADAETMIGLQRLENIEVCIKSVIADEVPGDLVETGVWRGGAAIFMRATLAACGDKTRTVWVADSFAGLPPPDPAYPVDEGDRFHTHSQLAVSLDEVQSNFRRYGLLDDRVRFLKGWFKDTLPTAPIDHLALLRLDGDMYGSTMDALTALYPRLSPGGFVIVDDYLSLRGAREAVTDFRHEHGIDDPIQTIDWTGVFWRRTA